MRSHLLPTASEGQLEWPLSAKISHVGGVGDVAEMGEAGTALGSDSPRISCSGVIGELLADGVEVRYEGPVTLGGMGRGRLHRRVGGIGEMVWEALEGAGWVGELATLRMTVGLRVGVAAAPATGSIQPARFQPLPGRARRLGEKGRLDERGVAWQESVGPLNGRAAGPGYRLVESEWRAEDLEFGEDLLFAAAVAAGWLTGAPDEVVDVPEVWILVSVARRNPRWETYANDPTSQNIQEQTRAREDDPRSAPASGAIDESALLTLALEVAARNGDPDPELVQHARGSRFDVTRTTGSVVFSDAPSWIVVMKGNFRGRWPTAPRHGTPADEFFSYPFQILVIDLETGMITDSGSANQPPDLTPLGEVATDHKKDGPS